jgi:hypothetical protein
MATVDQDSELNAGGASKGTDGVHGRASCSARKEDIVDNDHGPVLEGKRQPGRPDSRQFGPFSDIVPMHRNIDNASFYPSFSERLDDAGNPLRNLDAAQWNSRQDYRGEFRIALNDFVREPAQGTIDRFPIHRRKSGGLGRRAGVLFLGQVFLGDLAGSH